MVESHPLTQREKASVEAFSVSTRAERQQIVTEWHAFGRIAVRETRGISRGRHGRDKGKTIENHVE